MERKLQSFLFTQSCFSHRAIIYSLPPMSERGILHSTYVTGLLWWIIHRHFFLWRQGQTTKWAPNPRAFLFPIQSRLTFFLDNRSTACVFLTNFMSLSTYLEGPGYSPDWSIWTMCMIFIFDLVNCGAPDINEPAIHFMVFHLLQANGKKENQSFSPHNNRKTPRQWPYLI